MTDDSNDFEGFRVVDGGGLPDDEAANDEFAAPGRSVFGDDDPSFEADDDAIPHWSEPATGAVPQVGGGADAVRFDPGSASESGNSNPDELNAWAELSSTPRWADEDAGPTGSTAEIGSDPGAADDFFAFEEPANRSRLAAPPPAASAEHPSVAAQLGSTVGSDHERDIPMSIIVGLGLAALILAAMAAGPVAALSVVTAALLLGAVEFYNAVRVAGHQPAVLLGLTGVLTLPLAVYWRGEAAIGLVLVLSIVFGSLWYLMGVSSDGVMKGFGATMLGIVHIGVLGSFAALMLSIEGHGTGLLTAAILLTVAYDVGGLIIGKTMGKNRLSPASPNKTVEGLVGGIIATLAVAVVMGVMGQPAPLASATTGGGFVTMIILGIVVAAAAPIGDLAESQMKRDLGVKDMGSILPGHGGLLDRFDGLLFVLPVTWYVASAALFS